MSKGIEAYLSLKYVLKKLEIFSIPDAKRHALQFTNTFHQFYKNETVLFSKTKCQKIHQFSYKTFKNLYLK